jgi:hypothetical protein
VRRVDMRSAAVRNQVHNSARQRPTLEIGSRLGGRRHLSVALGTRPGGRAACGAVRYVRDLPDAWRKAEGGSGRQLLASALFDRIDVLGIGKVPSTSARTPSSRPCSSVAGGDGNTRKWSGREESDRHFTSERKDHVRPHSDGRSSVRLNGIEPTPPSHPRASFRPSDWAGHCARAARGRSAPKTLMTGWRPPAAVQIPRLRRSSCA